MLRARAGLAAAALALVGAVAAVAMTRWMGPASQRDALLQAADGAVAGRMVALGKELEREGAKVAGANLIKEARELVGGRAHAGVRAAKTHQLQQQPGAYPAVPAQDVGFHGGAPFKIGKNGNKIYDAPHVGGTNGVYMGANGGGNGWARKAPRKPAHKRQALSAVVPPFTPPSAGYAAAPPRAGARRAAPLRGMPRRAPPRFGRHRRPAFGGFNHREGPPMGNPRMHALARDYAGGARRPMAQEDSWEEDWGPYAPYPDYGDWDEDWGDDWDDEDENAAEPEEEEERVGPPPHEQVATGHPAAYDGAWGDQFYRNAGGHEEAMKKAGVNYDDYPLDVYRSIPYFPYDPTASKQMEQNQKIRAGKKLDVPHTQQGGANTGGQNMAAGWGTWIEGGEAEDNMRKAGLKLDHDPLHFRSGFPNPAWDKSEYDQARHIPKKPAKDAWEAVHNHRKSQVALESKGVSVNGFPIDKPDSHREYNQVDGLMDTLVPTEDTPKYRDSGVASQEHPLHFLLDEDVNGKATSQADGINKVFTSGKMDQQRQNIEDRSQGMFVCRCVRVWCTLCS